MLRRPWHDGLRDVPYLSVVTPPAEDALAISIAYFRDQHARVVNEGDEDPYIKRAIRTATSVGEHYMKRAIVDQTWTLNLSGFPWRGRIEIPMPPLVSVSSITYIDDDGVSQTLATSEYDVIREVGDYARKSTIERAYDVDWPDTRVQRNAVTITFRAGYIDTSSSPEVTNVPEGIKHAIGSYANELYKNRSESILGVGVTMQPALITARALFDEFKVYD